MDRMKDLRAGIEEMRSVAQRLMTWAADLEKSAGDLLADAMPAAPARDEVKVLLTKLCAAGYSAQVKALIASFEAASLSAVPEESLRELWEAAVLLREGADGGDGHAG